MQGAVALIGSGEFTPALESLDRELLEATGRARPRVLLLAHGRSKRRGDALDRTLELARDHLAGLGAELESVTIRERADADDGATVQAIGEADVIYVAGPGGRRVLAAARGSKLDAALRAACARGTIVAGCGRSADTLGERSVVRLPRVGWPVRWRDGLGLLPGLAVIPAYDAVPEVLLLPVVLRAGSRVVLGIDRETALVGRHGSWQVQGTGRVTVWRGRRRSRHRTGDVIRVDP